MQEFSPNKKPKMKSPELIKSELFRTAMKCGFDGFGVCSADDFSSAERARLDAWLESGMCAEMGYLRRGADTKLSPRKFMPNAISAICLAANFFRKSPETRIALYAQGPDYHHVLRNRIREVEDIIAANGGEYRTSIDASPLWEKAIAARAGIGCIGKNTLIIRKFNGPWSFLCVILCNLKLPTDAPAQDICGNCDICIKACPSRAISSAGIDARKCISYLTIEKKSALSEEETKLSQNKIFGCDACLRACPYGKDAPEAAIEEFRGTIQLPQNPSRDDLLNAARGTPMWRRFGKREF